jgi:hypothetical protein
MIGLDLERCGKHKKNDSEIPMTYLSMRRSAEKNSPKCVRKPGENRGEDPSEALRRHTFWLVLTFLLPGGATAPLFSNANLFRPAIVRRIFRGFSITPVTLAYSAQQQAGKKYAECALECAGPRDQQVFPGNTGSERVCRNTYL